MSIILHFAFLFVNLYLSCNCNPCGILFSVSSLILVLIVYSFLFLSSHFPCTRCHNLFSCDHCWRFNIFFSHEMFGYLLLSSHIFWHEMFCYLFLHRWYLVHTFSTMKCCTICYFIADVCSHIFHQVMFTLFATSKLMFWFMNIFRHEMFN